jgi:hypothetical protein
VFVSLATDSAIKRIREALTLAGVEKSSISGESMIASGEASPYLGSKYFL